MGAFDDFADATGRVLRSPINPLSGVARGASLSYDAITSEQGQEAVDIVVEEAPGAVTGSRPTSGPGTGSDGGSIPWRAILGVVAFLAVVVSLGQLFTFNVSA